MANKGKSHRKKIEKFKARHGEGRKVYAREKRKARLKKLEAMRKDKKAFRVVFPIT